MKKKKKLTEEKIDEIVTKEADDLTRWNEPILIKTTSVTSIRLSPETITTLEEAYVPHSVAGMAR